MTIKLPKLSENRGALSCRSSIRRVSLDWHGGLVALLRRDRLFPLGCIDMIVQSHCSCCELLVRRFNIAVVLGWQTVDLERMMPGESL